MAHSIITVATMKGGSGKSTLSQFGSRCTGISTDAARPSSTPTPNAPSARLAARVGMALGGVPVIADPSWRGLPSRRSSG